MRPVKSCYSLMQLESHTLEVTIMAKMLNARAALLGMTEIF